MSGSSFTEGPFPPGDGADTDSPAVRDGPPYRIEDSGPAGQEVHSYVDRVDTTRSQKVEKPGLPGQLDPSPRAVPDPPR